MSAFQSKFTITDTRIADGSPKSSPTTPTKVAAKKAQQRSCKRTTSPTLLEQQQQTPLLEDSFCSPSTKNITDLSATRNMSLEDSRFALKMLIVEAHMRQQKNATTKAPHGSAPFNRQLLAQAQHTAMIPKQLKDYIAANRDAAAAAANKKEVAAGPQQAHNIVGVQQASLIVKDVDILTTPAMTTQISKTTGQTPITYTRNCIAQLRLWNR